MVGDLDLGAVRSRQRQAGPVLLIQDSGVGGNDTSGFLNGIAIAS
jgi:hypothetical protein